MTSLPTDTVDVDLTIRTVKGIYMLLTDMVDVDLTVRTVKEYLYVQGEPHHRVYNFYSVEQEDNSPSFFETKITGL